MVQSLEGLFWTTFLPFRVQWPAYCKPALTWNCQPAFWLPPLLLATIEPQMRRTVSLLRRYPARAPCSITVSTMSPVAVVLPLNRNLSLFSGSVLKLNQFKNPVIQSSSETGGLTNGPFGPESGLVSPTSPLSIWA